MRYKIYARTDLMLSVACMIIGCMTNYLFLSVFTIAFGALALYDNSKANTIEGKN